MIEEIIDATITFGLWALFLLGLTFGWLTLEQKIVRKYIISEKSQDIYHLTKALLGGGIILPILLLKGFI